LRLSDVAHSWSKAIYAYALGVCSYEAGEDPNKVANVMRTVPDLMQRIAGKSIPLEKFVARKSKSARANASVVIASAHATAQSSCSRATGWSAPVSSTSRSDAAFRAWPTWMHRLAYFLNALGMSPRFALFENHLDTVSAVLGDLHKVKEPSQWGTGEDYWDGASAARRLKAAC
jgi:hypothetical protein